MYTATMAYHLKDESFDAACEIWKDQRLEGMTAEQPQQAIWDLKYFASR